MLRPHQLIPPNYEVRITLVLISDVISGLFTVFMIMLRFDMSTDNVGMSILMIVVVNQQRATRADVQEQGRNHGNDQQRAEDCAGMVIAAILSGGRFCTVKEHSAHHLSQPGALESSRGRPRTTGLNSYRSRWLARWWRNLSALVDQRRHLGRTETTLRATVVCCPQIVSTSRTMPRSQVTPPSPLQEPERGGDGKQQ
jgi:hypothetical protein